MSRLGAGNISGKLDYNPGDDDATQSAPASGQIYPGLTWDYASPSFVQSAGASGATTSLAPLSATYADDLVTRGNVTFDLKFSGSSTTTFQTEIADAAAMLASAMKIGRAVQFNIVVDDTLSGGAAQGGSDPIYLTSYSTVYGDLTRNAVAGDTNFGSLSSGSSAYGYSQVWLTSAQEKAFGTYSGSATADDGMVNFDPNTSSNALVGVALHELTHALGRQPIGTIGSVTDPNVFDLFRFTSQGHILVSDAIPSLSASFSVDGGKTSLVSYGLNSDPSDFLNSSAPDDAFSEFYAPGSTYQGLTQVDLTQLDVLGFDTYGSSPTAPCFCQGTRISTESGEIAVEDLRIGDLVRTFEGGLKPVVWIGHRKVASRFADPVRNFPVRIKAGALGENAPSRDLFVSPDHAMLVDDILVHAGALINGLSIVRTTRAPETFVYYHVELEDHAVILAENAPAETFVDNVERMAFDNWGEHEALYPDGKPVEEMRYPRAKSARQVPARIRDALMRRAREIDGASGKVA